MPLSAYERRRQANIAFNEAKLRELGLMTAGLKTKRTTQQRRKKKARTRAEPSRKKRKSSRLAASSSSVASGADAPVVPVADPPATQRPKKRQRSKKRARPSPTSDLPEELAKHEVDAFVAMREWKRARARELGFSDPCVICHNRTLIEIVRALPTNHKELLQLWGIGKKRCNQHGDQMLAAIAPFRDALRGAKQEQEQKKQEQGTTKGNDDAVNKGCPHKLWELAQPRLGLPTGCWSTRRAWCAEENGCSACLERGADASWGPQSQKCLEMLKQLYGGEENGPRKAGWRWFAKPNRSAFSHAHQWWPPSAVCDRLGIALKNKKPLGTVSALAVVQQLLEEKEEESDQHEE